ncbi:MAG: PH domain-containing protein [Bacillota bacterium]|nr:PH domain-containing protein [Bacillota bacterium]
MISFNKDSVINLTPIGIKQVHRDIGHLLTRGEGIVMAFRTVRDQLIFTNKRIISVDVQGITGKRKSFASLPYSKVQFFTIQTPGLAELVPDSELELTFTHGITMTFEFSGNVNIGEIGRIISEHVLAS